MRLTTTQREIIRRIVASELGDEVRVFLFGSRVDDQARGGDIDLLIDTSQPVERPAVTSAKLSVQLSQALDEQKVDVVLKSPSLAPQVIHRVAQETGVPL